MNIKKFIGNIFFSRVNKPQQVIFPSHFENRREIYQWIKQTIPIFREWYQPVDFGRGIVAHQTIPPDWHLKPEMLNDVEGGMAKWNYIIKKHLPSVKGRRVLDLGCSAGLFSVELARMGAREVVGIDRTAQISYRSTSVPPVQDVITQARFVKFAFEQLKGEKYPIKYLGANIGELSKLHLGRFDFILALCVVYHELDKTPVLINELSKMTDYLIIQGNETHKGELGFWSNKLKLTELLLEAGFTYIEIDAPKNYPLPVIVAKNNHE